MKVLWILPAAALLVCGCTTTSKVQQMIDANNQKVAAEQLKPEFERIAVLEAQLTGLAERLDVLEAVSARSEEKILNISLALNKAQGDMGLINQTVKSQQRTIREAATAVEAQNEMLLDVFRRQLTGLEDVIKQLEGDVQDLEEDE